MDNNPYQLTEETIQKLLEGTEDILTPLAQTESVPSKLCPTCGCETIVVVNPIRPFIPGKPLAQKAYRCPACSLVCSLEGEVINSSVLE